MRTVRLGLVWSLKDVISSRFQQPHSLRTLSANALAADEKDVKSFEHLDDSKRRMSSQRSLENNKKERAVLDKIDSIGKGLKSLGSDWSAGERSNASDIFDKSIASIQGQDASEKLRKAAMAFDGDTFEQHGRSRVSGPRRRVSAVDTVITTTDVLKKADFRNTRFLAKFITEGGIIMKRNQNGISAKAQRKIAREIKTARSMGLLPFTTQGTKSFVFGRSMQDHPDEYEYVDFGGGGTSNGLPSVMDDIDD